MYNVRYHIASLVAVFLALALGLVLGGLVVRQGAFDQQQRALVSSLQSEFNKLKKENGSLKSTLGLEQSYSGQMTDAWAANRLAGQTVLVLTSGGKGEGVDAAVAAVKNAGGSPAVVTILKPGLGLSASVVASAAAIALGTTSGSPSAGQVATKLAAEWDGTDSGRALTNQLVRAGVLKLSSFGGSTVATQLVDVAASGKGPDVIGLNIAQAYAAAGMVAVGAQPFGTDTGVAAAAAASKLSALDTLGTNAGRYTLVALFSGGQPGYYSSNGHGTAPFPPVPKP
jgi:hypothetical protein